MYSTKWYVCFLMFLMLLYMRETVASSLYKKFCLQFKSSVLIVFSCVLCVITNCLASAADGA